MELGITCKPLKNISFFIQSLEAYIRLETVVNWSNPAYNLMTLGYSNHIRIVPKKKKSLEWYENVIFKIRRLFTVLLGQTTSIESIIICPKKEKSQFPNDVKYHLVRQKISLLYQQNINIKEKDSKYPLDIAFTLENIGIKGFEKVINNWFENSGKLETTTSLYFDISINDKMSPNYKFLTVIQALEAYSRSKKESNKYMDQKEYDSQIYKKLIDIFPSNIDSSHRSALKNRIKYGNEYSLRKRIAEMIKSLPIEMEKIITNNDKKFVPKIIDKRNLLTHRDDSNEGIKMELKEFYNCIEQLKMLLEYFLLIEFGLNKDLIINTMTKHNVYKSRIKFKIL